MVSLAISDSFFYSQLELGDFIGKIHDQQTLVFHYQNSPATISSFTIISSSANSLFHFFFSFIQVKNRLEK